MFSEVTSFEDDASFSSKVLGCEAGLDFQVPCYLLQQETKLTGTLYHSKQIKNYLYTQDQLQTNTMGITGLLISLMSVVAEKNALTQSCLLSKK
jgi:hypothetical protein